MTVKLYLPISLKNALIKTVVANGTKYEDGFMQIDFVGKALALDSALIGAYSDIEVTSKNIEELYENGTVDEILQQIPKSEYMFLKDNADAILKQKVELANSLAGVLNTQLTSLISKIPNAEQIEKILPKLVKQLSKIATSISPEAKTMIKEFVNKAKEIKQ